MTSVIDFYTACPDTDTATRPEALDFEDVHFELREKDRGVQELTTAIEDTDARTLQASICIARNKQAGFDLVTLEAQPGNGNDKLLMLSLECKYSQKGKVAKNLQRIVEDKYRLWQQEMQKWTKAPANGTHARVAGRGGASSKCHRRLLLLQTTDEACLSLSLTRFLYAQPSL
jgi:hypothetical protein